MESDLVCFLSRLPRVSCLYFQTTLLYVELAFRCVFGHASTAPLCNSSTSKPTLSGLHSYNQLLTRYFCLFYDFFFLASYHHSFSLYSLLIVCCVVCLCLIAVDTLTFLGRVSHDQGMLYVRIRILIYSSLITQVVQIAKCESNLILASKRLAPRQAASSGSAQVL